MSRFYLIICAILLITSLQSMAQPFEVEVTRPFIKGSRFKVESFLSAHDQIVHFGSPIPQTNQQSRTLGLTGLLEVVEVNSTGAPKQLKCLLESFRELDDARLRVVIPGGQTLFVADDPRGKAAFRLEEGEMVREIESRASTAFGLLFIESLVAASKPQSIGSEWALDPKTFAKRLPENIVIEKAVTLAKLVGQTNIHGQDCLILHVKGSGGCAPTFEVDAQLRKQGLDFVGGSFKVDYVGLLPTNRNAQPIMHHLTSSVVITNSVSRSNGRAGIIHSTEIDSGGSFVPVTIQN